MRTTIAVLAMISFTLVADACPPPSPAPAPDVREAGPAPPPPATDGSTDGATSSCTRACARMAFLGCPEGLTTNCIATCEHVQATHQFDMHPDCIAACDSKTCARACKSVSCP